MPVQVQADSEENPPSLSAVFAAVPLEYRAALFLGLKDLAKLPCWCALRLSICLSALRNT